MTAAESLILGFGQQVAGFQYDAYLHAIFLGFIFFMLFVHAPIIFPAELDNPVVCSPFFYVFLAILQISLFGKILADLNWLWGLRSWTGLL